MPDRYPAGEYLLLFDPLDGSSNIDVNVSIGTIFSVLHAPHHASGRDVDENDFLQAGSQQVAAGYAVYGPQTMLVLTVGIWVCETLVWMVVGAAVYFDMSVLEGLYLVALASVFALIPSGPAYAGTQDSAVVMDAVLPHVASYSPRDGATVDHMMEVAFLVEEERRDAFEDALEAVAEAMHERVRLQLLGPMAPYDFVGP